MTPDQKLAALSLYLIGRVEYLAYCLAHGITFSYPEFDNIVNNLSITKL